MKKKKKSGSKKTESNVKIKTQDTLKLITEKEIALDFATKVYEKFQKIIKSIVLFGSSAKRTASAKSDIDIIIIIDDCSITWDQELIAWYREELGKIVKQNPYRQPLHINTVRLSTWWEELIRGEPVVINVIRYGEPLIDFGGFFLPLKFLLMKGKIKSSNEAIFITLQRAPLHMARSRASVLNAVEGLYWACVDAAHAALIAAKQSPPSPEHIGKFLEDIFVKKKILKKNYVKFYNDLYKLAHKIFHGEVVSIKGKEIDEFTEMTDEFVRKMAEIINKIT